MEREEQMGREVIKTGDSEEGKERRGPQTPVGNGPTRCSRTLGGVASAAPPRGLLRAAISAAFSVPFTQGHHLEPVLGFLSPGTPFFRPCLHALPLPGLGGRGTG